MLSRLKPIFNIPFTNIKRTLPKSILPNTQPQASHSTKVIKFAKKSKDINNDFMEYYSRAYIYTKKDFNNITKENLQSFLNKVNLQYKQYIKCYLLLNRNNLQTISKTLK